MNTKLLFLSFALLCSKVFSKSVVSEIKSIINPTKSPINNSDEPHKLVVVMVDGFRWDYFDRKNLKLKAYPRFVKNGVHAPYINPVHPSLCYPNIQSFATGLYPENHGFIENYLWDNQTEEVFQMIPSENSTDPLWWGEAEPVWVTSEKADKRVAMYWWPGCEVRIEDQHPYICERQRIEPATPEGKTDFNERIDDIVEMFKSSTALKKERLDMAMFYTSWIEYAGHYNGINSKELNSAIQYVDDVLDYLLHSLKKAGLDKKVNVMVVSDHGMRDTTNMSFIELDKYKADIKYQINTGPTSALVPTAGKEKKLYESIKKDNIKGLNVYLSKDIPESFHIKRGHFLPPIVLEAEPGYFIKGLKDSSKRKGEIDLQYHNGEHGYDSEHNQDMKGFFMAMGPDFKSGFKISPFDIIDLYNVMCKVLKLDAQPNNGTWEHVQPMLRTAADGPYKPSAASAVLESVVLVIFCVLCAQLLLRHSVGL